MKQHGILKKKSLSSSYYTRALACDRFHFDDGQVMRVTHVAIATADSTSFVAPCLSLPIVGAAALRVLSILVPRLP